MRTIRILLLISLFCVSCSFSPKVDVDSKIISEEPQEFLFSTNDLDGIIGIKDCYFTNENWIDPAIDNSVIVSQLGVDAKSYFDETGRTGGAWVYFKRRGNSDCNLISDAPASWISLSVTKYKTAEGALLDVPMYSSISNLDTWNDWSVLDKPNINLGNKSIIMYKDASQLYYGENFSEYAVEFAFHNYVISVGIAGPKGAATLDFLIKIAEKEIEKLQKSVVSVQ